MSVAAESRRVPIGRELQGFARFLLSELRPKGPLLTPFNVISVPIATDAAETAWRRALSATFRATLAGMENPYGDGRACSRILDRLRSVDLDERLIKKPFHDLDDDSGAGSAGCRRHG